ncbi:MAG TPA: type II secretion system protein [Gaiellaceae bacterium]
MKTDAQQITSEEGFGLIELMMAMVILQIALLALVGAFGSGSAALGRASRANNAQALANQQMELYRSMTYDAIGLNATAAPTTGRYVADTAVCVAGLSPVCGNTFPRNNANINNPWSCTAASGSTSVSFFYSANGINPCVADRIVSGAGSPDGQTYYVDTYIKMIPATAAQRTYKQVSVIVRDGPHSLELVKQVSTFDCGTANPPGAAPC